MSYLLLNIENFTQMDLVPEVFNTHTRKYLDFSRCLINWRHTFNLIKISKGASTKDFRIS